MKILALGPKGTYGDEAAHRAADRMSILEPKIEITGIELCESHAEVFKRTVAERCLGVVPIENSSKGFVEETVRDFWLKQTHKPPVRVIGEVQLPVHHSLVMRSGILHNAKTPVMSHQQALDQCRENLRKIGLSNLLPIKSTALAGKLI
ncbi:MAG: arogenate dehydratase/prephenate dehydratase 2, chloroplastic-like, partial [Parcubacteria group bacterium Gr01-1014_91]